jgi:hypothetical protein
MKELVRLPLPGRWTIASLLLLCGLVVFCVYYLALNDGVPDLGPDGYGYAQAARSIARGEGFRTSTISVLELSLLGQHGFPLPYVSHDLGNSLLLAAPFRLFGVADSTVGWSSGAFFILLPPLVFLLGLRLFEAPIALLAAALVSTNVQLITYSTSGLSEVPYAFFLTLLLYLLYEPAGRLQVFLIGVVYGALVVLRSNSLPFLPWIALYLCTRPFEEQPGVASHRLSLVRYLPAGGRAARHLGLFVVGFCLLFVPNAGRNRYWLGHPLYNVNSMYAALFHTSAIKAGKAKEIFSQPGVRIDPLQSLVEHRDELPQKVIQQVSQTMVLLLNGGTRVQGNNWADAVLVFLFLVSVLVPPLGETRRQRHFRWLVYCLMLTGLFVGALFNLRWRHFYGFIPIVMVYDGELATRFLGASPYARGVAVPSVPASRGLWASGGLVILLLLLGGGQILDRTEHARERKEVRGYYQGLGEFLKTNTPKDALVLVKPGPGTEKELRLALAWYGRRQTVEFGDYSLETLIRERSARPLFLLFASTSPSWKEPASQETAGLGFTIVERWALGTARAALFQRRDE